MGSGASRPDVKQGGIVRELSPQINAALKKALAGLDALDESFKEERIEERDSQLTKLWSRTCREIEEYLRTVSHVMLTTHQLSLDMGSDGGGRSQRPWLEQTRNAIDRLYLRLDDDEVVATVNDVELLRGPVTRISYEWIEEAVINWVLTAAEEKTGQGA